jgi:hypothetical protein
MGSQVNSKKPTAVARELPHDEKPQNRQNIKPPTEDRRKRNKLTPAMEERKFRPGQSGNPGGRPKAIMTDAYMRALSRQIPNDAEGRIYADLLAEKVISAASKGDIRAISEITDRVQGKVQQAVMFGGEGGGAIPFLNVSPAENEKRIAELLARAGGVADGTISG